MANIAVTKEVFLSNKRLFGEYRNFAGTMDELGELAKRLRPRILCVIMTPEFFLEPREEFIHNLKRKGWKAEIRTHKLHREKDVYIFHSYHLYRPE